MADKINIPLSPFVRELLISHLIGHTLWQERLRSWSPIEETVGKEWEEGLIKSQYVRRNERQNAEGTQESDPEVYCYR